MHITLQEDKNMGKGEGTIVRTPTPSPSIHSATVSDILVLKNTIAASRMDFVIHNCHSPLGKCRKNTILSPQLENMFNIPVLNNFCVCFPWLNILNLDTIVCMCPNPF